MGITFKTSAVALAIAVAGSSAYAQEIDRRGGGRGGGGRDDRMERGGGDGGGSDRRDQRQQQNQDRREQRQEQNHDRRDQRQPRTEERQQRPERPSGPQHDERRDTRREERGPIGGRPSFPRAEERRERPSFPRREERRENRREERGPIGGQPIPPRQRPEAPRREERPSFPRAEERRENRGPIGGQPIRTQPQHPDRDRGHGRGERVGNRAPINSGMKQQHRDHVRRDRDNRRYDIERRRGDLKNHRQNWRQKHRVVIHRDRGHIRSRTRWTPYYNNWWINVFRPAPVYVSIRWHAPMPDMNTIQYSNVENIATNLEYLSSEVYGVMADVVQTSPNKEYAQRLTRVLGQLADAAENLTDAVDEGSYYEDSLYDLFHLEEQVNLATTTLSGYSQEYRVSEEMNALRYYVQELLYIYRINM